MDDPARGDGRAGRVRHGVDEAPVSDAAPLAQSILEVADANAVHVLAERVVTGRPAATAIGGVVDRAVAGSDGAADNGGSGKAGADAPTPVNRVGFSLGGGGRHRAGDGEGSKGESGNLGLDRHE